MKKYIIFFFGKKKRKRGTSLLFYCNIAFNMGKWIIERIHMSSKGFGLISLMIVIIIILIIVGGAYFGFTSLQGRKTEIETGKELIEKAEELKEDLEKKQLEEINNE